MSQGVACRNNRPRDRVPLQKKKYLSISDFAHLRQSASTLLYQDV